MDEQRLWAPWRMNYIAGARGVEPTPLEPIAWLPGAEPTCFICKAAAAYADERAARQQNLVLEVSNHTITLLNLYPYNNGHLLVSPRRHVGDFGELTDAEHLEAIQSLVRYTQRYRELINAEGFNIGLNLGRSAGAGVPGHLHWHLVPRWNGDNNFMPVTGDSRVISQSLRELWEALTKSH
ncbi:HIT family protein [Lacipirellula sp.]|uniref:HIT family protein n=1 Tax=Lacipirellula sp. TaxID=2691419 RepID=UPI003D0D8BC7